MSWWNPLSWFARREDVAPTACTHSHDAEVERQKAMAKMYGPKPTRKPPMSDADQARAIQTQRSNVRSMAEEKRRRDAQQSTVFFDSGSAASIPGQGDVLMVAPGSPVFVPTSDAAVTRWESMLSEVEVEKAATCHAPSPPAQDSWSSSPSDSGGGDCGGGGSD
jgi:hypothetical protein